MTVEIFKYAIVFYAHKFNFIWGIQKLTVNDGIFKSVKRKLLLSRNKMLLLKILIR